ncbi:MAG: GH116 family glycosyl hydrolase [Candidatus Omnitrophica bacterium]|nr:GH116 family glycosyl hydrolase [Candidatus Omnitrophota bacterium]
MAVYDSTEKIRCGMPLGGIGAGKLEITPYGTLDYINFLNNWNTPLCNRSNAESGKAVGVSGFHFAIRVKTPAAGICKLLQTEKIADYPAVKKIEFDGRFPFARLRYEDDNLPIDVQMLAYSFFIPGDTNNSCLPAAVFVFEVFNRMDKELDIALLSMARNIVCRHSVGRFNKVRKTRELVGIEFCHDNPLPQDPAEGTLFLAVPQGIGEVSYLGDWNLQKDFFVFEPHIRLDAVDQLGRDGCLSNENPAGIVESQSVELGGALSVCLQLAPQERQVVPFLLSWHFPNHWAGHAYERKFRSAEEVSVYIHKHYDSLREANNRLSSIVASMGLEDWLQDALLNNLYPLISSSWFTRKGTFALYEAPLVCPLMGTLDVYFYASVAVGCLFPSLDCQTLLLFKESIRESGYVPHDLGLERLDLPSNGTTRPLWKDLNPKFIITCYRAFKDSGDVKFLKTVYPAMKRALEFSFTFDRDGDGLPENEGWDTTFDTWGISGLNSYTGGIFLLSLLVMRHVAELLDEPALAALCRDRFVQARKVFEEKLWNGKYYITGHSAAGLYEASMAGQLAGQWYAYVVGLGRMFSEDRVKSSIQWVYNLNEADSDFGLTNAVFADGKRDAASYHSQNVWPGVGYSFAALSIYEGFVEPGLRLTKKIWQTIAEKNKSPWNQADVIINKDGSYGFGDYYMRNLVIWAVVLALATQDQKVAAGLAQLRKMARGEAE